MFEDRTIFPPVPLILPYGMGVLTAYLKEHGIYVEQDDLAIRFNQGRAFLGILGHCGFEMNGFHKDIAAFFEMDRLSCRLEGLLAKVLVSTAIKGFDIIGFSIFSYLHFIFALLLSHKIKQLTDTPIVFGGPFISLYGQLYPSAFEYIDFMITGDGTEPLSQLGRCLAQKNSPGHIPGIIYKHKGKLEAIPRERRPLEKMPMPDFAGLPLDLYIVKKFDEKLLLPYQTSRGCNNSCNFCNYKMMNPSYEHKSYDKIIRELERMKEEYGSDYFEFSDSAINSSYKYCEGLCQAFIDAKINIRWSGFASIERLDREILGKMKSAGCKRLNIGLESGSDRMRGSMGKRFSREQAQEVLRESSGIGIQNWLFFISGYPLECDEDIKDTVDFIRENKKHFFFGHVTAFSLEYGSELWAHPEKHGITNLTPRTDGIALFMPDRPGHAFGFDEIEGLRWREKQIQQRRSTRKIKRAIKKCLIFNPNGLLRKALIKRLICFAKEIFYIRPIYKKSDNSSSCQPIYQKDQFF